MKPTIQTIDRTQRRTNRRTFPVTDCNYQPMSLGGYNGRCAQASSPSFHNISREYFGTEANHYFLAETGVFVAIMLTAILPLVNGAHAVLNLIRACGGI